MACCRSQWPRGLRRRSTAARLLRWWVRIPPWAWMSVCCECSVLSGRRLCDALITRPKESYRLWCVVVCDLETSRMRKPWPALGRSATWKKSGLLNQNVINFREEKVAFGVFFALRLMTNICQFYENVRFKDVNMVENMWGIFVCSDIPQLRTLTKLCANRLRK